VKGAYHYVEDSAFLGSIVRGAQACPSKSIALVFPEGGVKWNELQLMANRCVPVEIEIN